jgi:hypothetical protein
MAWSIQAWFLALAGIVIGIAGGADAGEDLTADEVLAKSQAAMAISERIYKLKFIRGG